MIVKRDEFIRSFTKWVRKKLVDSLPEEDFEMSMFQQAVQEIAKHNGCIKEIYKRP